MYVELRVFLPRVAVGQPLSGSLWCVTERVCESVSCFARLHQTKPRSSTRTTRLVALFDGGREYNDGVLQTFRPRP